MNKIYVDFVAEKIKNMACSYTDQLIPCHLVRNGAVANIEIPISRIGDAKILCLAWGVGLRPKKN